MSVTSEEGKRSKRGVHLPPGWDAEKARIHELLQVPPAPLPRGKPAIYHEQQQYVVSGGDGGVCDDVEDGCGDDVEDGCGDGATTSGTDPVSLVFQTEFEKFIHQAQPETAQRSHGKDVGDVRKTPAVESEDHQGTSTDQLMSEKLEAGIREQLDKLNHEPPLKLIERGVDGLFQNPVLQQVAAAHLSEGERDVKLSLTRFKKVVGELVGAELFEKVEGGVLGKLPDVGRESTVERGLRSAGLGAEYETLVRAYGSLEPLERKGRYTPRMTLFGHTSSVASVRFSPKGHYILSAGSDGLLKVWAVMRGIRRKALIPFKQGGDRLALSDAAFSPDQMRVLVTSDSHDAKIIYWPKCRVEKILNGGHTDSPVCCTYSACGRFAVTAGFDGNVILWDCSTSMKHVFSHRHPVLSIDFNPDHPNLFVTGCADGVVSVWDINHHSRSPILTWMAVGAAVGVSSVRYLPSSNHTVLSSSEDGHIRLSVGNHVVREFSGHQNSRHYVQCHYDLKHGPGHVFSGSEDGGVYVWSMGSGQVVDTLRGHTDTVGCLDVHPTSPIICTGSHDRDRSVKVWQMLT